YLNLLIPKVTSFIQRLRWRAFFFIQKTKKKNDDINDTQTEEEQTKETFGFNTSKSAPPVPALASFENDLYALISNLEFKNRKTKFQKDLLDDVRNINKSDKAFILADKTNNVYTVTAEKYSKLLTDNVTSHYKKDNRDTETVINKEAKQITNTLDISDRV
ncbi:MAG: hypothetical protein GY694_12290, partial [Gammaproteobacteria bacterium]|nr:hypothetical protein [Gammaproteobacteria bacterium]